MTDLSVRDLAARARTSDRAVLIRQFFKTKATTVRRWIAEGKLPANRTAHGWTVAEADLTAMPEGRPHMYRDSGEVRRCSVRISR